MRILLVDDHPDTRMLCGVFIERLGHTCERVVCCADAVRAAEGTTFDLLISDVILGDGDGFHLMRQLRKRQPTLSGISISGMHSRGDFARSRDAGFQYHLVKPVDLRVLEEAINAIVEERSGCHGVTAP